MFYIEVVCFCCNDWNRVDETTRLLAEIEHRTFLVRALAFIGNLALSCESQHLWRLKYSTMSRVGKTRAQGSGEGSDELLGRAKMTSQPYLNIFPVINQYPVSITATVNLVVILHSWLGLCYLEPGILFT